MAALLAIAAAIGCTGGKRGAAGHHGTAGSSANQDAGPVGVHARFAPAADPMPFGAVPWPDDLYLDATGHVALATLPGAIQSDYATALRHALADLDGFGTLSPVYFQFEGSIDPATLPVDEAASTAGDASVFLLDADTGSPDAFQRVAATMHWNATQHTLALRPALGHPLSPGRRYAAVITRSLKAADGTPVDAAPAFALVRDPSGVLDDPFLQQARAEYTPVVETLVKTGLARESIAALAVFTVQRVDRDLNDARALVRAGAPPTATLTDVLTGAELDVAFGQPATTTLGLDEAGGALHDQLLATIQGTLPSLNLLSATAKTHGAFERDDTGTLRVKRSEDVPFTLFLPKPGNPAAGAPTPVVIYQHALGRERSDAVLLANKLAALGFAVIAIDAPFHGLRANGPDLRNRFTDKPNADGFGDATDDFWGVTEKNGDLLPLHPFYARDALRQGAVDLMTVVRFLEEGDGGVLAAADPALKGLRLDAARIGFVAVDIGAQMGAMTATVEPGLATLTLAFAGGGLAEILWQSPENQTWFAALAKLLGRDPEHIDYVHDAPSFWPELAIVQTLLDRAEPLAHAAVLERQPVNVLLLMAQDDESVPNPATEALASALGATLAGGEPGYVNDLPSRGLSSGQGVRGNFTVDNAALTRVLFPYAPGAHDTLIHASGTAQYAHPPQPPWTALTPPRTMENPLSAALTQTSQYLQGWYACAATKPSSMPAATCDAPVRAP
jgi:alpha-beta hydrolase superfamily lysophospholipase